MAQRTLKGRVAIVGIGETHYYKHGQSPDAEFKLALQAILRRLRRRGHGSTPTSMASPRTVTTAATPPAWLSALGLPRLRSATMQWGGGGGGCCAAVANGAAAIATGQADCVVVFRSLNAGPARPLRPERARARGSHRSAASAPTWRPTA
jgi:acetyl-CoA acetyltransferase